jgi:hypothetical protein
MTQQEPEHYEYAMDTSARVVLFIVPYCGVRREQLCRQVGLVDLRSQGRDASIVSLAWG